MEGKHMYQYNEEEPTKTDSTQEEDREEKVTTKKEKQARTGSTQRYCIAKGSGEEERQENTEK